MHTLFGDIRYGVRSLLKQPGFTTVAVITLALGIGATTAIFSVVNTLLLRPLPYPDSHRLMVIWGNYRGLNIERLPAKAAEYDDYSKQSQAFDTVAAYSNHSFNVSAGSEPERIRGAFVTANLFPILEGRPTEGRVFREAEQQVDRDRLAVFSYGFWQRRFGGDRGIINRTVTLDDQTYTVIGVMPPDFQFPHPSFPWGEPAEVWVPLTYSAEQVAKRQGPYYLNVLAHLAPGVSLERARSDMSALGQRFEREQRGYRGPNGEDGGWRITVAPLQEEIIGGSRRALLVLFVAVGLLLLIACANVANLLLMRAAKRSRELAIRTALGASRWRIIRQLLAEGLLLTTLGAGLGLVVARWGIDLLTALGPAILPRANELSIDTRVLIFTAVTATLISIAFGLVPARQASLLDLQGTLKSGRHATSSHQGHWSNLLVVSEVAIAVLLLIGSGLLIRSLLHLQRTNPGIVADQLTSVEIDLSASRYRDASQASGFYKQLADSVGSLPGVQAVTFSALQPLSGAASSDPFAIEGRTLDPANLTSAGWQVVGANYVRTLGVLLLKGRDLHPQDIEPGAPVASG